MNINYISCIFAAALLAGCATNGTEVKVPGVKLAHLCPKFTFTGGAPIVGIYEGHLFAPEGDIELMAVISVDEKSGRARTLYAHGSYVNFGEDCSIVNGTVEDGGETVVLNRLGGGGRVTYRLREDGDVDVTYREPGSVFDTLGHLTRVHPEQAAGLDEEAKTAQ